MIHICGFVCPLCGGESASRVIILTDVLRPSTPQEAARGRHGIQPAAFPLVRCDSCSLLRLHPQPDDETIASAYAGAYSPFVRPGLSGRAKGWLEKRSVQTLWQWFAPPRRVLDVGCAGGEFLLAVRQQGNPNVVGVEPSGDAVGRARERGLDVRQGALEDSGFPDGSFDTVVMSHSIEHVQDPIATLSEVERILSPDGVLILRLPNADSIEARLFGRYWIGYDAPRHLTTFTIQTLTCALRKTGFRIVDVRHEAIGLEWAWALRLFLRDRWPRTSRFISPLHPLLIVAATPFAAIGAITRRSGRIRVIALKSSKG